MKYHILKSYSKLNLFLNVGKVDQKIGLHQIRSLVYLINLYDEIKIRKIMNNKDKIKFSGFFSKDIKKTNNSIKRSLLVLRSKGFIKHNSYFEINIKKKVPVFSGLGGGSSNSATLVKHLLKGRKISEKNLNFFSKKLGSDFKLFFYSTQIYQKNLNSFEKMKKKNIFYFVLVFPFLKCSTKEIYSKVSKKNVLKKNNSYNFNLKKNLINFLKFKKNDLEKLVIRKYPQIKKILFQLKKNSDCQLSRMTGSGSACFGVFLTKKSANLGLKKIKKKFPGYWCVISKTI